MKFILLIFSLATTLYLTNCDKENQNPSSTDMNTPYTYLALGDSYTIGESVAESERYPVQLVSYLQKEGLNIDEPRIIARTGWTTGELQNAIQAADLPDTFSLVSLLIGVNNQYRGYPLEEYKTEFQALLNQAIAFAGGRKERVLVLSIPDYAYTPFGQQGNSSKISSEIDTFNAANKAITEAAGVRYFDITAISRRGLEQPDLVAADGLHPSGKQYEQWVEAISEGVVAVLK